ncbi:MAG: hypothetical protein NTW01_09355 [Gammaproteobacteria bacterium]|uniref:hypothetical protein n=1 Tax=Nevskia sp. TaxID=1929292 RepID=UPI003F7250DF|nr:hypothetical protein [Gammaproteobacteria bacterium]
MIAQPKRKLTALLAWHSEAAERESRRRQAARLSPSVQVDSWNAEHPVGTPVYVRLDNGTEMETTTRSKAQVLSGHSAVIWLEGITGCYLLDRCRVRQVPA